MPVANSAALFCLENENHRNDIMNAFDELLKNQEMTDVILSCQGKTIKAHRMVLSMKSNYFKTVFNSLTNPLHFPVIFIKDMEFDDLKAIIEFVYRGKVVVPNERVALIAKNAESLSIKGLEKYFKQNHIQNIVRTSNRERSFVETIEVVPDLPAEMTNNQVIDETITDEPRVNSRTTRASRRRRRRVLEQQLNEMIPNGNVTNDNVTNDNVTISSTENDNENNGLNNIDLVDVNIIKTEHYDITYTDADEEDYTLPPQLDLEQSDNFESVSVAFQQNYSEILSNGPPEINLQLPSPEMTQKRKRRTVSRTIPLIPSVPSETIYSSKRSYSRMQKQTQSESQAELQSSQVSFRGILEDADVVAPRRARNPFIRKKMETIRRVRSKRSNTLALKRELQKELQNEQVEREDTNNNVGCSLCSRMFQTNTSLKIHMRRIHYQENKVYECNFCGKKYSWSSGLYKHLKIHRPPRIQTNRK